MTSLLDFYRQHGISPVAQDVSDLSAHFERRRGLYRSLGLSPLTIRGASVLEVGPGSGHNALYTLSLHPRSYVAAEPNPRGAEETRRTLAGARPGSVVVVEKAIEDFAWYYQFDVVFCEGLLGLCGADPKALLEHVIKHVTPGGVLVITCIDAISDHAEVLRRAMAHPLIDRSAPLEEQLAVLRPVFEPHLATLKGRTRSVDDWIIDNILNPASIGPTFSIPDACEALEGRFDLMGCFPQFLTDWRWYKERPAGNGWAIDSYWQQAHNLYDYRVESGPRDRSENEELMARCLSVRQHINLCERMGVTKLFLEEFTDIGWFGRGQQYLSFVKR